MKIDYDMKDVICIYMIEPLLSLRVYVPSCPSIAVPSEPHLAKKASPNLRQPNSYLI